MQVFILPQIFSAKLSLNRLFLEVLHNPAGFLFFYGTLFIWFDSVFGLKGVSIVGSIASIVWELQIK
jgi:hypothetical protein